MCMDGIEAWRKRPLLACNINAGVWYKLLQIIESLSFYTSRLMCVLLGMRAVKKAIPNHWLVDYFTVSAFGADGIVTKMQALQDGSME